MADTLVKESIEHQFKTKSEVNEALTNIAVYLQHIWSEVEGFKNKNTRLKDKQLLEKYLHDTKRVFNRTVHQILND